MLLTSATYVGLEQPVPVPIRPQETPTQIGLGSNPCFHAEKPAGRTVLREELHVCMLFRRTSD
jgi:hypothetical protein